MHNLSRTRQRIGSFVLYAVLLTLTLRILTNDVTPAKMGASIIGVVTGLILARIARHQRWGSNKLLYLYVVLAIIMVALPPFVGIALGVNILIEVALWQATAILVINGVLYAHRKINGFEELT